jgi:hypothetical protein
MLTRFDAAAVAATYGSVSAVTFVTAVQYLDTHSINYQSAHGVFICTKPAQQFTELVV